MYTRIPVTVYTEWEWPLTGKYMGIASEGDKILAKTDFLRGKHFHRQVKTPSGQPIERENGKGNVNMRRNRIKNGKSSRYYHHMT
jgi:hypothetical protein